MTQINWVQVLAQQHIAQPKSMTNLLTKCLRFSIKTGLDEQQFIDI